MIRSKSGGVILLLCSRAISLYSRIRQNSRGKFEACPVTGAQSIVSRPVTSNSHKPLPRSRRRFFARSAEIVLEAAGQAFDNRVVLLNEITDKQGQQRQGGLDGAIRSVADRSAVKENRAQWAFSLTGIAWNFFSGPGHTNGVFALVLRGGDPRKRVPLLEIFAELNHCYPICPSCNLLNVICVASIGSELA